MNTRRRTTSILVGLALSAGLLISTGCTKYASQDDLSNLEERKQAAISAEKKLDQAREERRRLEKEVAAKEAELQSAQAELDQVKSG